MTPTLRAFVRTQCRREPTLRVPVKEFVAAFLELLADDERCAWPRGRIVAALAEAGFEIGTDASRTAWVAGIDLRGAAWRVRDGRLVREASHA